VGTREDAAEVVKMGWDWGLGLDEVGRLFKLCLGFATFYTWSRDYSGDMR
jgi:hypothetical protein